MLISMTILWLIIGSCSSDARKEGQENSDLNNPDHHKKEVVVFVYHRFGNSKYPSTNISLDDFEMQLSYLKEKGFRVMNFGDAVDYVSNAEMPFIENVACITVDDGYKTFGESAVPLLKKYGFPATLFINSESVGGGSYMTWEELKEVQQVGIEIGNHSHSHAYFLNTQSNQRVIHFAEDVKKCQDEINKHLGFYPDVFAYPYGEFDPQMKNALKNLGFKAAAAQNSGVMYDNDLYAIPRFPMAGPFTKIEAFREKAAMKALRIIQKSHDSYVLPATNPPLLKVAFVANGPDLNKFNCFVPGECDAELEGNTITVISKTKLSKRRELYKITAPSSDGSQWYWFSHLWIQPDIKE